MTQLEVQEHQLAANPDLVTALFNLADQCVLIAPALALSSGTLPSLFQWAIQALQMREAEPVRKVIAFLSHWTNPLSNLIPEENKQASPGEGRAAGIDIAVTALLLHVAENSVGGMYPSLSEYLRMTVAMIVVWGNADDSVMLTGKQCLRVCPIKC